MNSTTGAHLSSANKVVKSAISSRLLSSPRQSPKSQVTHTLSAPLLAPLVYPHEALPLIRDFVRELGRSLPASLYEEIAEDVFIARNARVAKSALIEGPTVIGEESEIRHAAYIRGAALIGRGAVVGNSSEIKNSILFDGVQVPHYNYVGDSILGYKAHMGAGAIASNVRSDKKNVTLHATDESMPTSLRKIGAFLGDHAEIGCQAVLFPGACVGRHSIVYPLTRVRGTIPANTICKETGVTVARKSRP